MNERQQPLYHVYDRRLEQFLFVHDIRFVNSFVSQDGVRVWEYEDTPYLQTVLGSWRIVLAHRERIKNQHEL